jgi:hypothetical protein
MCFEDRLFLPRVEDEDEEDTSADAISAAAAVSSRAL